MLWPRRGLGWRNGRCSRPGCWTNRWTGMTPGSCGAAAWGAAWGAEGAGAGIYAGTESWDDPDARELLTELRRRRAAGRASSSALKKKLIHQKYFQIISIFNVFIYIFTKGFINVFKKTIKPFIYICIYVYKIIKNL